MAAMQEGEAYRAGVAGPFTAGILTVDAGATAAATIEGLLAEIDFRQPDLVPMSTRGRGGLARRDRGALHGRPILWPHGKDHDGQVASTGGAFAGSTGVPPHRGDVQPARRGRNWRCIMPMIDTRATATTRARYDRNARFYDRMERGNERRSAPWRAALWGCVAGPRVLEVGVGTGKNMALYPPGLAITAIDLAPRMLERARERARREGIRVDLREADAQALPFPNGSFDTVIATFVFCSVPDPVLGLRELRRVLRPGGQLLLLEHVLSSRPVPRALMRTLNPLVVRMMGANINRETVANVRLAGFVDVHDEDKWRDIVKVIAGRAPIPGDRM